MKKIFLFLCLFLALQGSAQFSKATLQASGLTCAMCSKAVYKALSAIPFVAKVQPDIEASSYDIAFKQGSKVDLDALSKAVVNAGFSVSMLKATVNFNEAKVQNNAHVTQNDQLFHFLNVSPQTLNGEKTVMLLDRNFVTAKDFKKNEKLTTMACYGTGMMDGRRVYHVTM